MLTTSSGVGSAGTAAALGNVTRAAAGVLRLSVFVTAAADLGFDDVDAVGGLERTVGRCWPVDVVLLADVLGPFAPSEPPVSADAVAGIEASAAPIPMATADAPSQPPNSTGSARSRVIVGMAKEFISAPGR
jgi:hypothetical protein